MLNDKKSTSIKMWREKYPQKRKAHTDVFVALRNGTLKKQPCEKCRSKKVEAHHDDYSKPLIVRWLCKKHHIQADKERKLIECGQTQIDFKDRDIEIYKLRLSGLSYSEVGKVFNLTKQRTHQIVLSLKKNKKLSTIIR